MGYLVFILNTVSKENINGNMIKRKNKNKCNNYLCNENTVAKRNTGAALRKVSHIWNYF